ncbi:uncharacterized protein LOC124181128 [Neodiprion fabricii]|uniref:uncharacterized protein LOC124181128 n=1 Tax=Neodiprion fabricii TaxID=2872261 RepID=UPI001ED922FF|nr:uncharacterized protein LOC124181128 [Neodiprion fabricii]
MTMMRTKTARQEAGNPGNKMGPKSGHDDATGNRQTSRVRSESAGVNRSLHKVRIRQVAVVVGTVTPPASEVRQKRDHCYWGRLHNTNGIQGTSSCAEGNDTRHLVKAYSTSRSPRVSPDEEDVCGGLVSVEVSCYPGTLVTTADFQGWQSKNDRAEFN